MSAPATHTALFYEDDRAYAVEASGFLRDGLARGHQALVMAPPSRLDLLAGELGRDAGLVTFVEDSIAYAPQWNAYRVLLDFLAKAPGVRSVVVAEQGLADRVPAEQVDYRRLEAAANLVFADHQVDLLCPYDAAKLPDHLLSIGRHTHETVREHGAVTANDRYDDPLEVLAELAEVVPAPLDADSLDCAVPADVSRARRLVRFLGFEAGLDDDVVADASLAVTEVLTNALVHGAPPALLHVYDDESTWVCHVHDAGLAPLDPLVGLVPPALPSDHGYGLWLARQLCAAVDVGSDATGTHVRLHIRKSG